MESENKMTKEEIFSKIRLNKQGKLSMIIWDSTVIEAMEQYATQQTTSLESINKSLSEKLKDKHNEYMESEILGRQLAHHNTVLTKELEDLNTHYNNVDNAREIYKLENQELETKHQELSQLCERLCKALLTIPYEGKDIDDQFIIDEYQQLKVK